MTKIVTHYYNYSFTGADAAVIMFGMSKKNGVIGTLRLR
jgi:hypothetical protein